jgi:hypothetical protein
VQNPGRHLAREKLSNNSCGERDLRKERIFDISVTNTSFMVGQPTKIYAGERYLIAFLQSL